ncbi:FAD:protein FMN transferase [Peptostreptococcus equinus]|uniref:FAD:protein FMN transferase n=1 Tax=Peptostreptococcus equinus TaxID=3003601 RepID=A0ABY7JPR8_9FIRM|nr:FAD:protein FMN transferase [Peptostreptococcus sp. CBA3647]WAW14013.1 FAD:protein FMN transferase [Peptostreptococcus sp. CBA3647]
MKKKLTIILALLLLFFAGLYIIKEDPFTKKGTFSKTNYYLDTVNTVTIIDVKEKDQAKILSDVDNTIRDIHNEMSLQQSSSNINKLNDKAGIEPVKVSNDIYNIIDKSIKYSKLTDGTFSTAVGPLTLLWGIGGESPKVPTKEEIDKVLPLLNYNDIVLNEKEHTIFLKKKSMKIDLGGIAKGYCADKLARQLKSKGVKNAIINLGGNIYVYGKNQKDKNFTVGIQDPSASNQEVMGQVTLTNKSVVTSGIYERYIEKDGKIYHHMLDPKTGYPFENNLSSVTIISDNSVDGDSLSTSTYGLGLEKGMNFINSLDGVDAIFITKDKKVYVTKNIKNILKITKKNYHLAN